MRQGLILGKANRKINHTTTNLWHIHVTEMEKDFNIQIRKVKLKDILCKFSASG